jgi:hypothetical protein
VVLRGRLETLRRALPGVAVAGTLVAPARRQLRVVLLLLRLLVVLLLLLLLVVGLLRVLRVLLRVPLRRCRLTRVILMRRCLLRPMRRGRLGGGGTAAVVGKALLAGRARRPGARPTEQRGERLALH